MRRNEFPFIAINFRLWDNNTLCTVYGSQTHSLPHINTCLYCTLNTVLQTKDYSFAFRNGIYITFSTFNKCANKIINKNDTWDPLN